jgi:hypothetical protein
MQLKVEAVHRADWWLGDPKNTIYSAASRAIEQVWSRIRDLNSPKS